MAERKRKPKPNPEMEQLAQSLIAAMASQQDGYSASDVYETMQEGLNLAMERLMQTELTDFLGYQIYNDVDEFLIHYSTQQTIPYTFFKKLVEHRNFALITILISTANYGVTDIPDDLALRGLDPVVKGGYYSNNNAFERFNTGKNAYAYPPVGSSEPINGGLGIAHFDDSHYLEFYKTFGYPEHCDINDLLYKTDSNHCCPTKMWLYSWFGTDFLLKGNLRKPPFARSSEPWHNIKQFFTHWQKFFRDMKLTV